jgi:hypothetical protein
LFPADKQFSEYLLGGVPCFFLISEQLPASAKDHRPVSQVVFFDVDR